MVELAILIGIFAYIVYGVGLLGGLGSLGYLGIGFVGSTIVLGVKKRVWEKISGFWQEAKKEKICLIFLGLILLQVAVNLIGAWGPELGFDALWYHLTIPKVYLQQKRIFYIPGNLFYYNVMPKLAEMLYLASLVFSSFGLLAKTIHFTFGILSAVVLYQLSKRYLTTKWSLLTVLIFYSTLIVGWQSITAYVDLVRTFFEILSLDLFLRWYERDKNVKRDKEDRMLLIESAIMLGLAISTKLVALASVPAYLFLTLLKRKNLSFIFYLLSFIFLIPLPWLIFSFVHTNNPVYPLFSGVLDQAHRIVTFNLIRVFRDFWKLLYHPQDFISPVFLIFLPITILKVIKGKLKVELKVLLGYIFLTAIFWYFTPRTGGSRFILPYLPAWSLLLVGLVSQEKRFFQILLLGVSLLVATVNLGYRAISNQKFLPVLLNKQTKEEFLARNLNFDFGDFFDIDGDLKKIIQKDDLVLVYGAHNLFYIDFPFVHASYDLTNTSYSYILVQGKEIPNDKRIGRLIYDNPQSQIHLFLTKRGVK